MKKTILLIALFAITSFNFLSAQSTSPAPYCDASFDDQQGFLVDDHINSISFGTLNNVTNNQYAAPHYVFYNNLSVADFTRGNSYTLAVNFTTAGGCGYGVWIDFNHNNTFETAEKIAGTTGTNMLTVGATPSITQSVTIPSTATLGNTRMRVRIVEDDNYHMTTTSELPCNASTSIMDVMDWGETEDYTINITSALGFNELNQVANLNVYPNPTSTTLHVKQDLSNNITYKIASISGKEIQSGKINYAEKQIDVSSFSDGIYFLELFDNHKSLGQQKFVKIDN